MFNGGVKNNSINTPPASVRPGDYTPKEEAEIKKLDAEGQYKLKQYLSEMGKKGPGKLTGVKHSVITDQGKQYADTTYSYSSGVSISYENLIRSPKTAGASDQYRVIVKGPSTPAWIETLKADAKQQQSKEAKQAEQAKQLHEVTKHHMKPESNDKKAATQYKEEARPTQILFPERTNMGIIVSSGQELGDNSASITLQTLDEGGVELREGNPTRIPLD